jgi:beta-lactamase class A
MSRKPPQRQRRAIRRGRRSQPYFLFWIVCGLVVLFGAQQIAVIRDLVAAPGSGAVDPNNLVVETTQLLANLGLGDSALQPDEPAGDGERVAPLRPLAGNGSTELRWAGPEPAPFVHDPVLAARIMERISGRSGQYGVAIKDLRSGRGVLVDADSRYEAASLFKLSVMYEVFKQREAGTLSFGELIMLTQRHVEFDLGTLDRPAGSWISIGEALERMITISDNSSAILLTDRVGAGNITRDLNNLGLTRTRLLLEDLSTSPADMLLLLETIARGEAVSREASADMIHLMARQRVNDRIPRLLPPGTIVAHKTGNLPGVVNDVGIVYGGEQIFVVAVLVDGTRNDGEASRITSELAAIAYEHFHSATSPEITLRAMGELVPTPAPWPTPRPTPTEAPRPPATATSPPAPVEADAMPATSIVAPATVTPPPPTVEVVPPTVAPPPEAPSPTPIPVEVSSPTPVPPPPATATVVVPPTPAPAHTATTRALPVPARSVPGGANVPGVIAPNIQPTPGR